MSLIMGDILAVCEILRLKEWRDLENWVSDCSRSSNMAPFDRACTTVYWSAIVSIALSCIISELFDVDVIVSQWGHSMTKPRWLVRSGEPWPLSA